MNREYFGVVIVLAALLFCGRGFGQESTGRTLRGAQAPPQGARVVLLGTGTPAADPERWGPAVAVVVDDHAYLDRKSVV